MRGTDKLRKGLAAPLWQRTVCTGLMLLVALGFAGQNAFGQITGEIRGVVLDPTAAAVPGAKVTLINKETGASREATSDEEGRFAFTLLPIGLYEVRGEAPAFRASVTQTNVRSGEIATVRFTLEVGQTTEVVMVTDAVAALDTENAQVQYSIQGETIQEIPVNRNPNLFATMAPGVIPVTANNPFLGSGSYNSNGSRGRANNITVDNITSTDVSVTGTGGVLGPLNFSQIKEVKLITNNFSAEYGRNSGSQLQYITKSGTNDFHGELYEYFQNDKLNARPFFDRTGKPNVVRQNTYGAVAGLPIVKNRLFVFGTYEGLKTRGAGAARVARVPTAAMIAQVTDPTSRALLQQYQLPAAQVTETDFGTVQQSAATTTDTHQYSARVDFMATDTDRIWGKFAAYRSVSGSSSLTFIGTNLANFGATSEGRPTQANLSWNRIFSPSVVNEATFAFGRSTAAFPINTTAGVGPRVTFLNDQISSFGVWEGLPQGRVQNTFQWTDILTVSTGRHNWKFGADLFRYQANSFFEALARPLFQFANWADFAAGRPTIFQQRFGSSVRGNRVTNVFAFAQDDWKATRNLTLNLGFRLEVAGGPSEVNNVIANLTLTAAMLSVRLVQGRSAASC